eukprot:CAMPEP_0168742258 /NCGR_PEP_ID=MMETSP0724-20121128/12942_1 /TAXON_ID=265536 /ORGANISM="Amphiprora sp., Strain CCMP467" /LENGTH=829 /DNA_ID=CAMNT_0008789799 /DNA_START=34 /DNA_END=2523 /DNA_ORIENTATION=-
MSLKSSGRGSDEESFEEVFWDELQQGEENSSGAEDKEDDEKEPKRNGNDGDDGYDSYAKLSIQPPSGDEAFLDGTTTTTTPKIKLELPQELLNPTSLSPTNNTGGGFRKPAAAESGQEAQSEASSFIPVNRLSALGITASASVASSVSDWTQVNTGTPPSVTSNVTQSKASAQTSSGSLDDSSYSNWSKRDPPTVSDDACSLISGFDMLDIDGRSIRKCHCCEFENEEDATFCKGCARALVNNPCPEVDAQIQINLSHKEERHALEELRIKERKRSLMRTWPLLDQARTLATEVHQTKVGRANFAVGHRWVPETDLVLLGARFLECAQQRAKNQAAKPIRLGYCFTSKNHGRISHIEKWGMGSPTYVLDSVQQAFGYYGEYLSKHEDGLFPIQEEEQKGYGDERDAALKALPLKKPAAKEKMCDPSACVGWIVAVTPGTQGYNWSFSKNDESAHGHYWSTPSRNGSSSQTYNLCTVSGEDATLPLICFDASIRNDKETTTLFNALEQRCLDLFHDMALPVHDGAPTVFKQEGTAAAALMALNDSKPEDGPDDDTTMAATGPAESPPKKAKTSASMLQEQTLGCFDVGGIQMRTCPYCDSLVKIFISCPQGCDGIYGDENAALNSAIAASLEGHNGSNESLSQATKDTTELESSEVFSPGGEPSGTEQQEVRSTARTRRPPVTLRMSRDLSELGKYQCLFRQNIELFEVDEPSVKDSSRSPVKTIRDCTVVGQVGLRCRHCAGTESAAAQAATYFPEKIDGIYHAAHILANGHLTKTCTHIPENVKQDLINLKAEDKTLYGSSKEYWAKSVGILGVYEDIKGKCLRFELR